MLDRLTNDKNSPSNTTPVSTLFSNPTFSQFSEEPSDFNLKSFIGLLQRRAIVIIGVASVAMGGVIYTTFKSVPIYESGFQILVEPVNSDSELGKIDVGLANALKPTGLDYESQIQVLKSPELLGDFIKEIQKSYPDINYYTFLEGLNIRRLGESKIIQVSYKSDNSRKIKSILDPLADFYLKYSLNKRQTKLRQGVQFVDAKLPEIRTRLGQLQKQMQMFRQRYNFIDPENQSQVISSQIQSLAQQRLTINQQLIAARASYDRLQRREEQLAILNTAPLYQTLIGQQRQLDTQISGELTRFQPDNPVIRTLQEKRANLLPIIEAEAARTINIRISEVTDLIKKIEVDSEYLTKAEKQIQIKLDQLPVLSRQYTEILRNLQIANESLNRFLAAREQLQIEIAQTELPWELIQAAIQPSYPISPDIPRNLILGFVASSLLAIGAAVLREQTDNTYHGVENVQDKIGLPLLGSLPFNKNLVRNPSLNLTNIGKDQEPEVVVDPLVASDEPSSTSAGRRSRSSYYYGQGSFWESLQVLYNNIQLLNSDRPIKSLVISSALPGDGKSTVAFSLAKTAAIMGKKVLLVDCDLRKSKIHKLSQLNNLWGISSLISSDIDVNQVIQEMPQLNGLSVITAGPVPPDPARLLSSDKMSQMMDYFSENFDLVIYDTPPLSGLVDARLVAVHTDGVVLVIRIDKTDKSAVKQLIDTLKASPINLLGVVVNGEKFRGFGYNYNYRYSSYYYTKSKS
ncbi:polysaccharide biosynthesis tyrosine autokinase [Dolichospermum circinale CS-1225]|uniref:GumC family protein n=1 Tax=Dolichospermum circinale TaxID=109265 RepID=UPI00232D30E1|nr:polysaccharide biosynthesis tyrosine autokinase [Dolichospermum circinale]MDB9466998.1 polysaccharide biosynthesis tyrosine autokinase [Dolichospermum circinale CS-539/09]MDB9472317.1 polysaccharide biosynthesis tyrosine autokinase [Dolichospermum circinale CS-539]MDB9522781.1 polysaccharide biosynthesis tyrosine autokinase [Dolichospermum circinale CS-1225]